MSPSMAVLLTREITMSGRVARTGVGRAAHLPAHLARSQIRRVPSQLPEIGDGVAFEGVACHVGYLIGLTGNGAQLVVGV